MTPDTHVHTNYIQNLLRIAEYVSDNEDERAAVFAVLTERLVQIDAHIDKNEEDEVSNQNTYSITKLLKIIKL